MAPQHSFGYVRSACTSIVCQGFSSISIIPKLFAQVLLATITEDSNDHSFSTQFRNLVCQPGRTEHVGGCRDADQQPLLASETPRHVVGILCIDPDVVVCQLWVVNSWMNRAGHMLRPFQTVHG